MTAWLDVEACRQQFPGLAREVGGRPAVFLDGPGGSQVPQAVIEAVADCLTRFLQGGKRSERTRAAADVGSPARTRTRT